MSMRRKSRALLIRKPIPLSALICSATISVSQAIASDWRSPTSTCGAALGTMIVRNRCQNENPSTLSGFEELRVDLADRREGVEVQREAHPERDQQHLGQLADAEPEDEQRDQAEVRQRAHHLHGRVDRGLEPPRQPDRGTECDADETAEQQTLEHPDAGYPQGVDELTVARPARRRPRRSATVQAARPAGITPSALPSCHSASSAIGDAHRISAPLALSHRLFRSRCDDRAVAGDCNGTGHGSATLRRRAAAGKG